LGVPAKSFAKDASLPVKATDVDPAFEKAIDSGDLDTFLE